MSQAVTNRIMNVWNPVGIIDIGSNSVRMVLYNDLTRHATIIFNEKVSCGLGRELASTGRLGEEAFSRAIKALKRFRALADQMEVQQLLPFATAAAREAKNGPQFIAMAEEICRAPVMLMTGEQEAEHASYGIIAGFHKANGLMGDMGGGSLEIQDIRKNGLGERISTPLGGLRLIDVSGNDIETAREYVANILDDIDWLNKGEDRPFYAVGGTWRAFARMHMEQIGYPMHVLHGYRIIRDEAFKFAHLIDHIDLSAMSGYKTFSRARRETIPFGALVLEELLKRMRPSEIVISSFGVREGLMYSLLEEDEQQNDPLHAACSDLASNSARCHTHAGELANWMDALFKKPGPKEKNKEKRLRLAACYLSDIGWRYHPDFRADQVVNIIAYADFAGVSHKERIFLAAVAFFRYRGIRAQLPEMMNGFLSSDKVQRAKLIAAAIRLAYIISVVMPGVLEHMPIVIEDDNLILRMQPDHEVLRGEKLDKRIEQLAELMGLHSEIQIIG